MRHATRALLGSAAGVFAVTGAQAADVPVNPPLNRPARAVPVEYVKVCTLYGAGFWYVPGTDTCIKIGAYVKLQAEYNATNAPFMLGVANNGAGDTGGRRTRTDTAPFTWNNRGVTSFDMRTQTEFGTLRSYIDIGVQTAAADTVAGSNAQLAAVTVFNSRAFIQFAGFTVGRIRSFFDMYFQGTYTFAAQRFANDTSPNGIIGAAYTWQFGGGWSATVSLEDASGGNGGRGRSTVNASLPTFGVTTLTTDFKGQEFFDPVFNLRIDQAWGFAGISAALHDASGGYNLTTEGSGHPGDKFGWAVSPAFLINSPFGLQGDTVAAQAVWSKGAAGFATPIFGPTAVFDAGLNLGVGWLAEGVFANGTSVELTTVWSFNAAYEHRWNPQWRTSVYGGMVGVQFDDTAKQLICASPAVNISFANPVTIGPATTIARPTQCDPNFSLSEVGTRTLWNPVPDLDVGFDLVWWHLNTAFNGATATLTQQGAKPPSNAFTISNQDAFSAIVRVQRNFLY